MPIDKNTRLHLRWLDQQSDIPMWGAHIVRGEPLTDPDIKAWLDAGLIKLDPTGRGYIITDNGRRAIGH